MLENIGPAGQAGGGAGPPGPRQAGRDKLRAQLRVGRGVIDEQDQRERTGESSHPRTIYQSDWNRDWGFANTLLRWSAHVARRPATSNR
jgi:hypothetical protein